MKNSKDIIQKILNREQISFKNIEKATSGFTNEVYFIDDNYVIKLSKDYEKKKALQKEIDLYHSFTFDFVPKFICNGTLDGWKYLIISKLHGKPLYSFWHTIDKQQKIDLTRKIAEILKQFHTLNTNLPKKDNITDWQGFWKENIITIKKRLETFHLWNKTIEQKLIKCEGYLDNNDFCTIYNDAHFDNFIYDNGKLYLIDFDRVQYCPKDYELLIFKSMCDEPWKFANEHDEPHTYIEDYDELMLWLKEFYPDLFKHPHWKERLDLYQLNYYLEQAYNIKDLIMARQTVARFLHSNKN